MSGTAGTLLATGLFAGYLSLRVGWMNSVPGPWELFAVVAALVAGAAGLTVGLACRESQRAFGKFCGYVAEMRRDPALRTLGALPASFGPLNAELEELGRSYRQAVINLADKSEDLEAARCELQQATLQLQSLMGRADSEEGRSQFRVRRGDNNSQAMVARLTPSLHWMVATPALQRFLGHRMNELNSRSFLDSVHPADVAPLRRVFQDALDYGEAHNITCRLLTAEGEEHPVQIDLLTRYTRQNVPLHLRCHFLDISERVRRDQELRRLALALRDKAKELEQANHQLRRINRELDNFCYVVSHDLKEPLRTLEAFSNFLAEDYGSQLGPDGQDYIQHLIQASRRLWALIDDLLTLSRAGRIINSAQRFDLNGAIDTVRSDLADLIHRKRATLRIEGPLPAVAGDPQRVIQLLTNLVSNGLKYNQTPQPEVVIGQESGVRSQGSGARSQESEAGLLTRNGLPDGNGISHAVAGLGNPPDRVTVRAAVAEEVGSKERSREPGQDMDLVTLYVRDNGIGIDPKYHEQIFGMFRRLHRREDYEGTGAGLAICKRIVEAHGGQIWVESQIGQGATFYFTLPQAGRTQETEVPSA
jgi:PAS domain S-box-containing protein